MSSALASRVSPPSPACLFGPSVCLPLHRQAGPSGQKALFDLLSPMNAVPLIAWFKHHGRETSGSWPSRGPCTSPPALATLRECVLSTLEITHLYVYYVSTSFSLPSYKCYENRNLPISIHSPQNHNAGHTARHKQVVN